MITDAIFDWARRTPDKTAVVHNGEAFSYRSFAAMIAAARGHFEHRGCAGSGVAVLAVNHLLDFWVLSLALRSLGLTTMTAQPGAPIESFGSDARFAVAIVGEDWPGLAGACTARGLRLVWVDGQEVAAPPPSAAASSHPPGGHILQTSGTTGAYKRVLMHPSFEGAFMQDRRDVLGVDQSSIVAVFNFGGWTGIGYNSPVSTWDVGATVVIDQRAASHMGLLHPGLTHAMVIPVLITAILAAPEGAFPFNAGLHLSVTSGTITQAQIDLIRARMTPRIFNRVGSTEVNTFANTALESPEDHRWHRLVQGREVQIVDDLDRPVRLGEVGRVRVSAARGPNGYLDDEEATRTFFKEGFFYPGDLAVQRGDGRISLQGRVTDVINVNGIKIAPAPIEDRLCDALGVSGACLVSAQDENGEEKLHLALEAAAPIDTGMLTEVLQKELHGFSGVNVRYMAKLPRNDRGKLQRAAVTELTIAAQTRSR